MGFKEKIRHYWHDFYYDAASPKAIQFAMRCQHVAEIIDLAPKNMKLMDRFRFRLHLSLCQACANYYDISRALKKAILELIKIEKNDARVELLNRNLLVKHANNPSRVGEKKE